MLVRVIGALLILAGVLVLLGGTRALAWFGQLPGDLRIGVGSTRFHLPLASLLLVSLALTAVSWILRRLT